VLAYFRKLARWPITSFEATGKNDRNVVMGITKLWRNFERSFVFLKRSGRVAVALQHVALVKELPSLCLTLSNLLNRFDWWS
jgi:hypothetical protein